MLILHASSERDFEAVFATIVQTRIDALSVGADPFIPSASIIGVLINPNNASAEAQSAIVQDAGRTMGQKGSSHRDQLIALAARYRIPAIYEWREFVQAGGLMSYGSNLAFVQDFQPLCRKPSCKHIHSGDIAAWTIDVGDKSCRGPVTRWVCLRDRLFTRSRFERPSADPSRLSAVQQNAK
jgi:hypothetical protein